MLCVVPVKMCETILQNCCAYFSVFSDMEPADLPSPEEIWLRVAALEVRVDALERKQGSKDGGQP